jgi:hypothetical protein
MDGYVIYIRPPGLQENTMTQTAYDFSATRSAVSRPLGFLLAPFGWAKQPLVQLLQQETSLLADLIHLSRIRMHLIALALAHTEGAISPELAPILFRGCAGDILDATIGHRPTGLKRVIRCLPREVLQAENYRRLVPLLADPAASKLLYHAFEIDDATIKIVDGMPIELRSLVFTMQTWFRGMESLGDGLHWLVRRGAAPNFDVLVADLAHVRQPEQLIARIRSLIEALPLPDALPPIQVEHARRLDYASELRKLAKRWRNCLDDYVWRVDGGDCAIYLWQRAGTEAVCAVRRRGRLGWFLGDVKGPRNSEIDPPHLDAIKTAFDDAGMPSCSVIRAVEDIVELAGARRLRRRPRRQVQPPEQPDDGLVLDAA